MKADDYVHRVNFWLSDLPWKTKKELLSGLQAHLGELPAETDLRGLGTPEQYAADLRAAAGLEHRRGVIAFLRARRPRNLVLTVVVLTVMGLAIGAVVWVDSYQPLVAAGSMANPAGAKDNAVGGFESVVFHQGRPFRFGIDIRNDGSHTVRVLGVSSGPGQMPFAARLLVSGPSLGGTVMPMTRFDPFDLPPGQIRLFMFRGSSITDAPEG